MSQPCKPRIETLNATDGWKNLEELEKVQGLEVEDDPTADELDDAFALMHSASPLDADQQVQLDALNSYFNQLKYVRVLSPEAQHELARRYAEGDVRAGEMLVWTNLRLVVKIAREYARRWSDLLDLIQEGNVGLTEALSRYNPDRGVRFTAYAQYWVRALILNYLMNHLHPVRLGSSRAGRKLFYNLKKARRALIAQGIKPTTARIAEYLEVSEEDVVNIVGTLDAGAVYLDAPVAGSDDLTVGDTMASNQTDTEDLVVRKQFNERIRFMMEEFGRSLTDARKSSIWHERVLPTTNPAQLAELGAAWSVSKERIRQIEMEIRDDFKYFLLRQMGNELTDYVAA